MFIDKDSIQIKTGNGSFKKMGGFLVEAKYGYNKLWSSDSGRNLAGKQSGTLIGIFPKLTLQFRKLTQSELEEIIPIFDSATQIVRYYDPRKKDYRNMETYTGDYEITNKNIIDSNHKNEGFSISFIARSKR